MKLEVYVEQRPVAILESQGDFKSILTYDRDIGTSDFVSLTMPVRTESYVWDDQIHPIFRMNLPEGYLLQVLEERFGPLIGASPIKLLAIVGRNMVGRLQVAPPGSNLNEPIRALDVAALLQGDNSERPFAELVREYATSGVSGVVPKFLDADTPTPTLSRHNKTTFLTRRHIIKGASKHLPYISLNESLAMEVSSKVAETATTRISQDGQALVVDRFDVDEAGQPHCGLEDFCVLLGLRPAAKYETTWERIAKAVRTHVPGSRLQETYVHLAKTILLTYALRNADCHAKNIALLYTSREDVKIAPVFDMLTTNVYPRHQDSPPGISFMGKQTWNPGKSLGKFLTTTFNISLSEQRQLIEKISDAVADVGPSVRKAMIAHPDFRDIGKRLLASWNEGVMGLRDKKSFGLSHWSPGESFTGFSDPPKMKVPKRVVGKS